MSMINFHDPTVINWNVDNNGKEVSLPRVNETKQVVDGKVPLEGLPDEQYRVKITGYVEINIKDKIDAPNKFKCDYVHGILYFDQSKNGTSININKYYSRGQFYIASSRIWTKLSNTGEVIETMGDVEERLGEISGVITNLDGSIDTAKQLKTELNTSVSSGNVVKASLDDSINIATTKKTQLDDSISNAATSKSNLDVSISDANTSKINLDESTSAAITTKANLDTSISSGGTLKTDLDNNISTGTTLKSDLDNNINEGNQLKTDLPPIIAGADISKSNLDNSISIANTKKVELDSSIGSATTKKSELDASISSANLINDTLSNVTTGTIKKANDINSTLNTTIADASTSKTDLDNSIGDANISKSNLDESISTANTTKTNLDGSISEGNVLKSELDDIIAGTDFEQIIPDINALKIDKADKIYVDNELETKVDNSRVLTDVPSGAKFTDTITTISGKTGEITKADIVALGIPTQDTVYIHPTTAGNKHIPVGGNVGQILKNTESGTATWQDESVTPIANNLDETVVGKALDATQGKVLDDKISILTTTATSTSLAITTLKFSELSSIAKNVDSEGIYKNTEWRRKDNTIYAKSTLLGTSPAYNQIKMDYYDELGTTIIKSITWELTYDENDFVYKKDVI